MQTLIVYFSHPGETFVDGHIKFLKEGNTKKLAEKLHALTGGVSYELIPVERYVPDYESTNERARQELVDKEPPALLNVVKSVEKFDVIYIGFPIWHRTYPRIIDSFLQNVDVTGKVVKLFCTNAEGNFGTAELELNQKLKGAKIKGALSVRGEEVDSIDNDRLVKFIER